MKKILPVLIISLLLLGASCALFQSTQSTVFTSSTPIEEQLAVLFGEYDRYNGSVCVGISGPYASKSRAVTVATERCLQTLSFYSGLAMQAEAGLVVQTASDIEHFNSTVFGGTSDAVYERTAARMEIVDVQWYGGKIGAAVFARLPEMEPIPWTRKNNWVEQPPEIPGFTVAATSASRSYSDLAQAIEAATFRSAEALLNIAATNVTVTHDIQQVRTDQYKRDLYSISGIKMDGFVVLSYRYDVPTGRVYALAVTKRER